MKNKIINTLGFIIVIYGLALGFVLIIGMLDYNDPFMIFLILPTSYFIAIYEYSINKTTKQQYKESTSALLIDIDNKDKKIANHIILGNVRIERIGKLNDEITELKTELKGVAKKEKQVVKFADNFKTREDKICYLGTFSWNIARLNEQTDDEIDRLFNEFVSTSTKPPFNTITETWICPECGSTMIRNSKSIVFCDNILCHRKQWKKAVLSATEVMK